MTVNSLQCHRHKAWRFGGRFMNFIKEVSAPASPTRAISLGAVGAAELQSHQGPRFESQIRFPVHMNSGKLPHISEPQFPWVKMGLIGPILQGD